MSTQLTGTVDSNDTDTVTYYSVNETDLTTGTNYITVRENNQNGALLKYIGMTPQLTAAQVQ